MGSGSKRKSNDQVRINTPAPTTGSAGTGSEGATGDADEVIDINQVCPIAFRVKISQRLRSGLSIELVGAEMRTGNTVLGKLNSRRAQQLVFCTAQGITYAGKTENDDGATFVRFEQVR